MRFVLLLALFAAIPLCGAVGMEVTPADAADAAGAADYFADAQGTPLSNVEMQQTRGSLLLLLANWILPRLRKIDLRQKASNSSKTHCDVIAQNRCAQMGLDTRSQNGSAPDYNQKTVKDIYGGYPANRSASPQPGTAGYIFTSYGNGKEHMGAYSRTAGSSSYTRYSNNGFTESRGTVPASYKPAKVTSQVFVALPRVPYSQTYYR